MSASTLDIRRRLTIFMIVSYMVVWLEISTAAPIALRLEFGNARVMPWTWQSFTANAVCGPSEGWSMRSYSLTLLASVISLAHRLTPALRQSANVSDGPSCAHLLHEAGQRKDSAPVGIDPSSRGGAREAPFCLIIFGGIVLMPRVISSTVALAMFLQHEHHLREAADYIPIDQLGTTDDCGFVPFADDTSSRRNMAFEKIRVRIVGTRLTSEALGREDWTRALHAGV